MLATVRNRRGVISGVNPYDGDEGRLHLVDIEYNDGASPLEQSLLWEREPNASLLKAGALPDPSSSEPMSHNDFDALIRACRWTARMPFIDPDGSGPMDRLPVSSPFHGAVQIEDYQLIPLLKAIRMPRVSLLIADDVGLGKTIEAGLILSELLLRRRARRVLILTPASLRDQWQEELWEKFSLNFDIVDRDATVKLRRQVGMDANPWRSYSRVITSYHYLKQPDVLEQLRAAGEAEKGMGRLPWDLLIVDEAHNLSPTPFGEESELTKMLRQLSPLCEHRIFLTATPHNGHTRSFTGLLELLDPVRFSQTAELKPAERARVQDVLVRRLKREINERSNPKKFAERNPPESLVINLSPGEKALSTAFSAFRSKVLKLVRTGGKSKRRAGNFAVEILGKRLLSCPVAFADSWHRVRRGMHDAKAASEKEVLAAQRSVADDTADDRELNNREQVAATTVGAWLHPMAEEIEGEAQLLDTALESLGLLAAEVITDTDPAADSRYQALLELTTRLLRDHSDWKPNERLIIFTEYKTTLDYLVRRLRADLGDPDRILTLFGGMTKEERKAVKRAFNDEEHQVRILVATDAASEGLNLQKSARFMFHYDIPWNPSRLEQRNGRLDRHGQSRDVTIWHFASSDDQDLKFLDLIVRKVDAIREDLGSAGEVFDELTHQKLVEGIPLAQIQQELDAGIQNARKRADFPRDNQSNTGEGKGSDDPAINLQVIARELDLNAHTLHSTLDAAMAIRAKRPQIEDFDEHSRCRITSGFNKSWSDVIDDTVRMPTERGRLGALPALVFDPDALVEHFNGRPIFQPRRDVMLMHLAQPLIQRAITSLTRLRFPGSGHVDVSRWYVSTGEVPAGADAVIQLTIEELGVNELRETFHHWVRTVRLPVISGELGEPLEHLPPAELQRAASAVTSKDVERAQDSWLDAMQDTRRWLQAHSAELSEQLQLQLELDKSRGLEEENERYRSRQGEVSALIENSTIAKLERELAEIEDVMQGGLQANLFEDASLEEAGEKIGRKAELLKEELERRQRNYEEVREQLAKEREYIIKDVLPRRFSMRGEAQVLPVTVEIVLPEVLV